MDGGTDALAFWFEAVKRHTLRPIFRDALNDLEAIMAELVVNARPRPYEQKAATVQRMSVISTTTTEGSDAT